MSILFFDIETASCVSQYSDLSPALQKLWDKKCLYRKNEENISSDMLFTEKAGIYAEFGRIVCIVCGYMTDSNTFALKSFAHNDEQQLIKEFFEYISSYPTIILCGHNIKEFDIPYICRRAKIHWLPLPETLNLGNKKPREVNHKDTMEMWKFGDYKAYTSLALLCELFGIETPKDDIDGSQVSHVYRDLHDIDRIVEYCKKDVVATAKVYEKLK